MDRHWYREFFQGLALDFWRHAMSPDQTRAEAAFLERTLGLVPGSRVLDVPCGLGRHALELAARGYRVNAVDLSAEAIAEARRRAAESGHQVDWIHADMCDLPFTGEIDGAYCFGNSFGYLEPAGTRAFLGAVSRALKPGARFALDSGGIAESVLPRLRDREWARVGDMLFLEHNRYHALESCLETTYTFVRGERAETRQGLQWIYTLRELCALLAETGLTVQHVWGSIDLEPFHAGSPYLVLVAEKNA